MRFLYRITFVSVLLTTAVDTTACDCILTGVKEAVKRADAVLLGTVISVKDLEIVPVDVLTHFPLYVRRVEIIVDRAFKGRMVSDTVVVYTAVEGTECGFDFRLGLSYIVYGDRDTSFDSRQVSSDEPLYGRGIYWTSTCTRTRAYDEEEVKDIDAL